jgi:tRNA-Thr(GGU) m(6)t(6)A37 methyltransferase TsaA
MTLKVIAHICNRYDTKFGVPRQSGLADSAQSTIVFTPEYRNKDALRGIEEYSHLWLIWQFSEAVRDGWSPTVRPPRLGGNKRVGVFATRSPFRPNELGLSSVQLVGVENTQHHGTVLHVKGADLMNGTPIFDIKPYLSYTDSHPDAVCGFADRVVGKRLQVIFDGAASDDLPNDIVNELTELLAQDPRPSYQDDGGRVYGLSYGGYEVKFTVRGDCLTVTDVSK